eukprot:s9968_g1.t1
MFQIEARQILDNLLKSGNSSSAETLQERIAQCEVCEIFTTKHLKQIPQDKMNKYLLLTRDAWSHFDDFLKLKLAEREVHMNILHPLIQELGKESVDQVTVMTQARNLAQVFNVKIPTDAETGEDCSYDMLKPSVPQLVGSILMGVVKLLGGDSAEEVEFGLEHAVAKAEKEISAESPEMKKVKELLEASNLNLFVPHSLQSMCRPRHI